MGNPGTWYASKSANGTRTVVRQILCSAGKILKTIKLLYKMNWKSDFFSLARSHF